MNGSATAPIDRLQPGRLGDGLSVLGLRSLAVALAFGLSALLARVLGPEGLGVYATVIAAVAVIGVPAQLGIPTLILRETARARATNEWNAIPALWRWGRRTTVLTSLVLCIAALAASQALVSHMPASTTLAYGLGLLLIPLAAMTLLNGSVVQGLGRPALGQAPETTVRPAVTAVVVGALALAAGGSLSPIMAVASTVAGAVCAVLFSLAACRLTRPLSLGRPHPADSRMRAAWLKASLPLALVAGLQAVNQQTSPLLLSLLASGREVGLYRAVTQLGAVLIFVQTAVAIGLAPRIAALHQAGDKAELQALATAAARLTLLFALPGVLLFILFGRQTLGLIFGADFIAGAGPLAILALGQGFNAACGLVVSLLNMTGHARHAAWGMAVAAGSNLGLHLVLVPPFGMTGAAIASAVSIVLWNVSLSYAVFRTLGVGSSAIAWRPRP